MADWAVGYRSLRQGDFSQAIPVLEHAFGLAQVADIRVAVPWVASPLGAAYALAGQIAKALSLLEQAVEQAETMPFMADHALRVIWLSEAYLRAGRLDEAYTQAQRTLAFSRAHQERGHEAYALRLLGDIAARRDPLESEQVTSHYRQALTLAEELGMRPLMAHCHLGLGILYSRIGRREQARTALSTALTLLRSMGMTFWLPQAAAALATVC
jgi:tetratricopeptide (TPR) repeat protein